MPFEILENIIQKKWIHANCRVFQELFHRLKSVAVRPLGVNLKIPHILLWKLETSILDHIYNNVCVDDCSLSSIIFLYFMDPFENGSSIISYMLCVILALFLLVLFTQIWSVSWMSSTNLLHGNRSTQIKPGTATQSHHFLTPDNPLVKNPSSRQNCPAGSCLHAASHLTVK